MLIVLTETGRRQAGLAGDFRRKHRGGQGVRLISLEGAKTGNVAAVELVAEDADELMLISSGGSGRAHRRQQRQPPELAARAA